MFRDPVSDACVRRIRRNPASDPIPGDKPCSVRMHNQNSFEQEDIDAKDETV